MAQRPARASTKSKRPTTPTTAATAGKSSRVEAEPKGAKKAGAAAAKPVRQQTKPVAVKGKPASTAGKVGKDVPVTTRAPRETPARKPTKTAAEPKAASRATAAASKAASVGSKATKTRKSAAPAKAARKAPKAAASAKPSRTTRKRSPETSKPSRTRKTRQAPAYLAAELGQPVDHEGEPIGAGSPRVQEDGPLQEYALQLWRQMQSGGVVKRYLRAIERAGLTVDEVWTVGLGGEARSTSSTPDEMRRYKQRLLFRANLLEALLTETIADLHRLEGIEPTPRQAAVPEPTPPIPSEAA